MFEVIDRQTKEIKGTYKSRNVARRNADKLDNIYGGYRYYVNEVSEIKQ